MMYEIVVPDPFRPTVNITLSGSVHKNLDGNWQANFYEDNPGYGTAYPSTVHSSRKKAEKWVRKQASARLARMEEARTRLLEPVQPVDLSGIR